MTNREPRRPPGRPYGLVAVIVAAGVAAAALYVALRLSDGGDVDPLDAYGVTHVHGLGVNPDDGALLVATHNGSFRIADEGDSAERIGDNLQDTMGFTVVGPNRFLGSGHPDLAGLDAGQPSQLGLLESTDGGATWSSLSLSGDVDFHGLAYVHDRVYGWDATSGRFMISSDRVEWDTRSTLDLHGFAVDPANAYHIVGAAPDGLIESSDAGSTWVSADGPPLIALSWDADAGLWGADGNGGIYHRDSTDRWERRGCDTGPDPGAARH